jgi:hypothetical protein
MTFRVSRYDPALETVEAWTRCPVSSSNVGKESTSGQLCPEIFREKRMKCYKSQT